MASFPKKLLSINLWLASLLLILHLSSCPPILSGKGCSPKLEGYPGCNELELNATLHFRYNRDNSSLSVVYVASPPTPEGWVGWGINPKGSGMIGSQVIAAFRSNKVMMINTFVLKSYHFVTAEKLSIDLWDVRAEQVGDFYKLYATIRIPSNIQSINHTWSIGSSVTGRGDIQMNAKDKANFKWGKGELDFADAYICAVRDTAIMVYKITNPLGWTILFFTGLVVTKLVDIYPTVSPTRWYFLQMICQLSGWAAGALHSGSGIMLDLDSVQFIAHRQLGAAVFFLATFVLIVELYGIPDRDNKNKSYWNLYFYNNKFGYAIMVIGALHVFRGFEVFPVEEMWKAGYISVISFLFGIAILLEVLTCTTRKR